MQTGSSEPFRMAPSSSPSESGSRERAKTKSRKVNPLMPLLRPILKHIRFPAMHPEYIVQRVDPLKLLTDSEMIAILSYQMGDRSSEEMLPFPVTGRVSTQTTVSCSPIVLAV